MSRFLLPVLTGILLAACQTTNAPSTASSWGSGLQVAAGPKAISPSGSGLNVCSDYGSNTSCTGNKYLMPDGRTAHAGIDFLAPSGTTVISATHGEISEFAVNGCGGGTLTVVTDIEGYYEPRYKMQIPVYAKYVHVTMRDGLAPGDRIRPGDHIGFVQPWAADACSGPTEHVHYELRVLNNKREHVDPNPHWLNGPGKVTCFSPDMVVPSGKAVAPLHCAPSGKSNKRS